MHQKDIRKEHAIPLYHLMFLNFITCGLEFCASATFTYLPPMLLKAGISDQYMTVILGLGPLIGLFVVPVIGRASDRCTSSLGRRRPFIIFLCFGVIISLVIIPSSFHMASSDVVTKYRTWTVGLLILGVVMLDFCSQAAFNPFEALLSDICKNTASQETAFSIYSFMMSLGGCIGYLITALDWSESRLGVVLGSQEQSVFTVIAVLFILSFFTTLTVMREKPLLINSKRKQLKQRTNDVTDGVEACVQNGNNEAKALNSNGQGHQLNSLDDYTEVVSENSCDLGCKRTNSDDTREDSILLIPKEAKVQISSFTRTSSVRLLYRCFSFRLTFNRFLISVIKMFIKLIVTFLYQPVKIVSQFLRMPLVLRRIFVAHFLTWTALICHNLFYTDFVGHIVYGGDPNAPHGSPEQQLYDIGVRMGSWGLLFHCITSASYSWFLESIISQAGARNAYMFGIVSFTCAMISMIFIRNVVLLNLVTAITGFGFATFTAIPFALITQYQQSKTVYFSDCSSSEEIHQRGSGSDMAVLDAAFFLAQVVLSACMGSIVHVTGTTLSYIVFSALISCVACISAVRIIFDESDMRCSVT